MLANETFSYLEGYDYGMCLKVSYYSTKENTPPYILTDAKSICYTITNSKGLGEIRLMNDIEEIRRAYVQKSNNVRWLQSEDNWAGLFTRPVIWNMIVGAMVSGTLKSNTAEWMWCEE